MSEREGRARCEELLREGLAVLRLSVSPPQQKQLLTYIEELSRWNKHFNLTAVDSQEKMVRRHLLDSLAVSPYLQGTQLIDVGTGAGLPGLPLAIVFTERKFFLLDNKQKKHVFITQMSKLLCLQNIQPVLSAVETYQPSQKFSTILTRAFAPLNKVVSLAGHLLDAEGRFLAMLGKADKEALWVPEPYEVIEVVVLKVPEEKAARHLAIVIKS